MASLLISDDHFGNDRYGLLEDKLRALREVLETYIPKVSYFIHAADITDRQYFDTVLVSKICKIYQENYSKNVNWSWLIGNHCGSERSVSPMTPFVLGLQANNEKAHVIGNIQYEKGPFVLRGWNDNKPLPVSDRKYAVMHCRVAEWSGTEQKAYTLCQLNAMPQSMILLGDTHQREVCDKVISIGTFAPSSHKDDNLQAGFILLDEESDSFEWKNIGWYPVFRTFTITEDTKDLDEAKVRNAIVAYKFHGSQKWIANKQMQDRWRLKIMSMYPRFVDDAPCDISYKSDKQLGQETKQILTPKEVVKQRAVLEGWRESAEQLAIKHLA